jgi:hypothetical protein
VKVSGIPYVQGRNSYSDKDGIKYGIAIHNTSNNASDEAESSYATRRTDGVSSHFYCDKDSVTQSLDTAAKAGHAGSTNGNENAIAVEITGANGWSRAQWLTSVAWDQLGRVLADVCRHYGIAVRRATVAEMQSNPKVKAFYGHDDMRRAWGGTTHTDPGPNFPWDRLFQAVNAALGGGIAAIGDDDMTPEQSGILGNTERILSAMCTRLDPTPGPGESEDRTHIKLVQPWAGGPAEVPNPVDWLIKRLDGVSPGGEGGASAETVAREVADVFSELLGRPLAS